MTRSSTRMLGLCKSCHAAVRNEARKPHWSYGNDVSANLSVQSTAGPLSGGPSSGVNKRTELKFLRPRLVPLGAEQEREAVVLLAELSGSTSPGSAGAAFPAAPSAADRAALSAAPSRCRSVVERRAKRRDSRFGAAPT